MLRSIVMLCLVFLMLPVSAFSAGTIADIKIVGNDRIDAAIIQNQIRSRVGQAANLQTINQDIRAIYKTGQFSDVSVREEDVNGIRTLIYQVTERPLIRAVIYEGREELERDKLDEAVALTLPAPFDPNKAKTALDELKLTYKKEGFYRAKIDFRVNDELPKAAELIFEIDEGPEAAIRAIRFDGNTALEAKALRKVMQTKTKGLFSIFTGSGTYFEELVAIDVAALENAYKNEGYLKVQVRKPLITVSDDGEDLDLLFEIDEGERFSVGTIDLKGEFNTTREEVLNLVEIQPGETYNRSKVRRSLVAINDLFADRGYANVNVSPLQQIDDQQKVVHVVFAIEQGQQVYINRISVSGNQTTIDKVVRREMALQEGDLYSASKFRKTRKKIKNTGYFEEVGVSTRPTENPRYTDINVEVTEQSTGAFTIGAGYDTEDGAVATASISEKNFLGRGFQINASGTVGEETSTYRFGVTDPYFLDLELKAGFEVYRTENEWDEFTRAATGGKLKLGWSLNDNWRTLFTYNLEKKDFSDINDSASPQILALEGTSRLSSLSNTLTRNTTDYTFDPSEGGITRFTTEVAGLGGDEKFTKFIVDHRHFFPLFWDTVFSVRGNFGYLWNFADDDSPLDERFFPGGMNSIRGFDSREVGPQESNGASPESFSFIGGDVQAFANFDFIFPLNKEAGVKGVFFFDTGNSWSEFGDAFRDFRYSAGFELRWRSPFGPLRVGYGRNLDPQDGESAGVVLFSFGTFY